MDDGLDPFKPLNLLTGEDNDRRAVGNVSSLSSSKVTSPITEALKSGLPADPRFNPLLSNTASISAAISSATSSIPSSATQPPSSPQPPSSSSSLQLLLKDATQSLTELEALKDRLRRSLLQTASSTEPGKSLRLQKVIESYRDQVVRPQSAGRPDVEQTMMREFLDWRDETGSSALINASCFGNREICYLLLSSGASVDQPDSRGWTPLVWATNNGYDEIVRLLLSSGASAAVEMVSGEQQMAAETEIMTVGGFLSRATASLDPHSRMAAVLGEEGLLTGVGNNHGRSGTGGASGQSNNHGPDFYRADPFYLRSLDDELQGMVGVGLGSGLSAALQATLGGSQPAVGIDYNYDDGDKNNNDIDNDNNNNSNNNNDDDDYDDYDEYYEADISPRNLNQHGLDAGDHAGQHRQPQQRHRRPFDWELCLPDQMLVFDQRQTDRLLDAVISQLQLPAGNRSLLSAKFVSANVIFLAARYAHSYGGVELIEPLLNGAMERVASKVRSQPQDMSLLAYWLANCSQLLNYFRRDSNLASSTGEWQRQLADNIIPNCYRLLVKDAQRRLLIVLQKALCDYESIPSASSPSTRPSSRIQSRQSSRESVQSSSSLVGSISGAFRRLTGQTTASANNETASDKRPQQQQQGKFSILFSSFHSGSSGRYKPPMAASPRSITTILSSTLFVLQCYEVHQQLQCQLIRQLYFYIGGEVFNLLLKNPQYCCRWKAIQIRMNLSQLEEWARNRTALPTRQARSSTTGTPSIEELIRPFDDKYARADDFIEWLDSAVLSCQIMQIATTSFAEHYQSIKSDESATSSSADDLVQAFDETIRSLPSTKPSSVKRQLQRQGDLIDEVPLNYLQLLQLLAENYVCEPGEQPLARCIREYLAKHAMPSSPSATVRPENTGDRPTQVDLIDLSSDIKEPPVLFHDSERLIPFQLPDYCLPQNSSDSPPHSTQAASVPPGWQTGLESPEKQQDRNRVAESWQRVRIEVPGWLLKAIDNPSNT